MERFKRDLPNFRSVDGYWVDADGKLIDIKEDMSKSYIKSCIKMCKKLQQNKLYCDKDDDKVYELLQSKIDDLEKYL